MIDTTPTSLRVYADRITGREGYTMEARRKVAAALRALADEKEAARDARRAALEEVRKATAAIKDRSDVSSDAWTLTLVDAAIRALIDREPAPGDARPRISDDYTHSGGQAVTAAEADAAAARRQVRKLREALAQAKAQIVTAAVADERNRYGYRTDMALWATVALRTIDEALGHE